MITIRIPISVGRFLYSVIEWMILHGNLADFKPKFTVSQRRALSEFHDTLFYELTMAER